MFHNGTYVPTNYGLHKGMNNRGRADMVEVPLHGHETVIYGNKVSMYEHIVEVCDS